MSDNPTLVDRLSGHAEYLLREAATRIAELEAANEKLVAAIKNQQREKNDRIAELEAELQAERDGHLASAQRIHVLEAEAAHWRTLYRGSDDENDSLREELAVARELLNLERAERDRLREALRPFASLANDDDARDYITVPILMSAIRRAQAALKDGET